MSLKYDIQIKGIKETIAQLNACPAAVESAIVSGCNKLAAQGITQAKRSIAQIYNLKTGDLKDAFTILKAQKQGSSGQLLFATIHVHGYGVPLYKFGALPQNPPVQKGIPPAKRRRVTIKMMRGGSRTTLPTQFVAKMETGHLGVFRREGKGRLPIKESYAVSIPTMFEKEAVKDIEALMDSKGQDIFKHELEFFVDRLSKSGGGR